MGTAFKNSTNRFLFIALGELKKSRERNLSLFMLQAGDAWVFCVTLYNVQFLLFKNNTAEYCVYSYMLTINPKQNWKTAQSYLVLRPLGV